MFAFHDEAEVSLRVPDLGRHIVCRDFLDSGVATPGDLPKQFHVILGGPSFAASTNYCRVTLGPGEGRA
jgi:hypothetical protein